MFDIFRFWTQVEKFFTQLVCCTGGNAEVQIDTNNLQGKVRGPAARREREGKSSSQIFFATLFFSSILYPSIFYYRLSVYYFPYSIFLSVLLPPPPRGQRHVCCPQEIARLAGIRNPSNGHRKSHLIKFETINYQNNIIFQYYTKSYKIKHCIYKKQ